MWLELMSNARFCCWFFGDECNDEMDGSACGLGGVMMKWEVEECGWKWLRGCTARKKNE